MNSSNVAFYHGASDATKLPTNGQQRMDNEYEEIEFVQDAISEELVVSESSEERELVDEPFKYSYAAYEDITNLGMDIYDRTARKEIHKHIRINEAIIEQTQKMLKYGSRKTLNFVGSQMHLEGERILLISKMRKQVLLNSLYGLPPIASETRANVNIQNLKCLLKTSKESQPGTQYYICILYQNNTVFSTKIVKSSRLGWINLGGYFAFKDVSNTCCVKIQLHCVHIPTHRVFALPILNRFSSLPTMDLVGEVSIGMYNITNKSFTFQNKEGKLFTSIEVLQ